MAGMESVRIKNSRKVTVMESLRNRRTSTTTAATQMIRSEFEKYLNSSSLVNVCMAVFL